MVHIAKGKIRFATNYITLKSLLKKKFILKKLFMNNEWIENQLSHKINNRKKGATKSSLSSILWPSGSCFDDYKPLNFIIWIVDIKVVPIIHLLHDLLHVIKESLK